MKQRKEACAASVFSVDSIVTVYHFPLESVEFDPASYAQTGVIYDFWQLFYVERGECAFEIDGHEVVLCDGQLSLCEPKKERKTKYMKNPVVGIVSFRCRSEYMDLLKNAALSLTEDGKRTLQKILQMGAEIFTEVSDPDQYVGQELKGGTADYQLQMIKNLLEIVMIDIMNDRMKGIDRSAVSANQQNYYQKQFVRIEAYLKDHLCCSVNVADVCAYTGLSVGTVKRICRACVGCGVIHYFLSMKIDYAKQLIRDTELNYMQISEKLGFSSIHYFSRLFKTISGLTPGQYAQSFSHQKKP